ncbi:peptidase M24, structural domain-containing protein [Mycena haematopus]|nr:peptidase M24, structural domain-containing protein [Mycena haematopus]
MLFCLPFKFLQPKGSAAEDGIEKPPPYRSIPSDSGAGSAAVLSHLRALLSENKLDAYIIPNEDEHGSEIPAASELRRGFMTGFHGTAGLAVVTQTNALLFVDSRYWIAAEKAMNPALWMLRKVDPRAMVAGGFQDYLCQLPAGSRIGVDARLIPPALKASLDSGLPAGSKLVCQRDNLVDKVWKNKPMRSTDPVTVHPLKFTGRAADSKLAELRETIAAFSPTASYLVTPLDDLVWLLNLRGNDMFNQPFFYAYFFVSATDAVLFIDPRKVTSAVEDYLTGLGVRTQAYGTVWEFLTAETERDPKSTILVDPKASYAVMDVLGSKATVISSPINAAKAIKNAVEIQGFFNANLRDSVAMVRWYGWLEEQVVRKKAPVTEYEAQMKLNEYRSMEKYWGGPCHFISAYGPSAALPHYAAEEDDCLVIERDAPYLIDSGQQYLDATIDTTRQASFHYAIIEHKRAFTRVLQAHIAVDALIFPAGTTGTNLGLSSSTGISVPFVYKPGHVTTNEPGFYDEGKFGCRIESTIVVVKKKVCCFILHPAVFPTLDSQTLREFDGDIWMGFDRCTMVWNFASFSVYFHLNLILCIKVPIQRKLVDFSLLTKEEKAWLNAHNKLSYEKLRPLLKKVGDKRALALLGNFF